MEMIFEVLKYILPSLVVFFTVYYILKQYFQHEYAQSLIRQQRDISKNSLPLKLQSYERLALFLERIRIPNLALRFQSKDLTFKDICNTMIMGVQQEYEHNMVQQIYVSEKLWEIIVFTKNEILHELDELSRSEFESVELARNTLFGSSSMKMDKMVDTALSAIKKEIQLIL